MKRLESMNTVDGFISHWSRQNPTKKAIVSVRDNEEITYRELDNLINYFCDLFSDGIDENTYCTVLLDDTIVCHAIVHTVFRLGAKLVPIDSDLGLKSIEKIINHVDSKVIFFGKDNPHSESLGGFEEHLQIQFQEELKAYQIQMQKSHQFSAKSKEDSVAMLAYTSGTTSNPKGVVLRHKNLVTAYKNANKHLSSPSKVGCIFRIATLGTLGIHFFYPQFGCGTTVLLPKLTLMNARSFWDVYIKHDLDFLYLVPSFVKLLNHFGESQEDELSGLIVSAGAPLPKKEQEIFQEKFNVTLRNIYGLTESSFAVFYGADNDGHGLNTIGPALSLEAKVVGENGETVKLGETGELVYRGDMVADGYFLNDEATKSVFNNGWLSTGDLVREVENGCFEIVGRKKDVIIRGGFNIHPSDIEEVILEQDGVVNAFAFGTFNEVKGDELSVLVHLEEGRSELGGDFIQNVKNSLGKFRSPDQYLFTSDGIPLNAAGKIDKKAILKNIENEKYTHS